MYLRQAMRRSIPIVSFDPIDMLLDRSIDHWDSDFRAFHLAGYADGVPTDLPADIISRAFEE